MPTLAASRLAWVLLAACLLLAWSNAFIQDDAFISFRYAENLVNAHELTWNAGSGERVEGYTNFLWVLMLALPIALGLDPVPASQALGLGFASGTLWLTYRLAAQLFGATPPALLAMALLGTNYTFSAYATGGLETQMQAFWIVAGAYAAVAIAEGRWPAIAGAVALSTIGAMGVLTRLDSALPFGVLFGLAFWGRPRGAGLRGPAMLAGLLLPAAAWVVPWLIWKLLGVSSLTS